MSMKRRSVATSLVVLLVALSQTAATWQTQADPIRVLSSEVENDYPDSLTFNLIAEADTNIVGVDLFYWTLGGESPTWERLEITPATHVEVTYTWDTSRITVAPSTQVFFYWELEDSAGNTLTTDEQSVYYDDLRFPWNNLSDEELVVRWYAGDQDFGELIYQTAREALDRMKVTAGRGLEFPVFVLLYATEADFQSWHFYVHDWVGGQAFTSLGITTQILGPGSSRAWIESVIPHEIAHLFFYQAIHTELESWPAWLDEGLAQYYEIGDTSNALARAAQAAREGEAIPLRMLSGGFGIDPVQVRLSYDESLSAVMYLLETWGDEGLQAMMEALRWGRGIDQAMIEGLGLTFEEFEASWLTWMGSPATPQPSPTAWPTFSMIIPPTRTPHPPTTPVASEETTDGSPEPDAPTESPLSTPSPTAEGGGEGSKLPFCGGLFGALALPLAPWLVRRRRQG